MPYQSAARRFTMAMVALPIAIVTTYMLYERTLGEGAKRRHIPGVEGGAGENPVKNG